MTQGWFGARSSRTPSHPLIKQLVEARLAQNLTKPELARKAGYSVAALDAWEAEHGYPSFRAFQDWAQALGFDIQLTLRT